MNDNNRKCILCSTAYKFCGNCSDQHKKNETWRNIYCSENCKNIFNVLSLFANGHIDQQKAKDMLLRLDISNKGKFREDFRKQMDEIVGSPPITQDTENRNRNHLMSGRPQNYKREFVKR